MSTLDAIARAIAALQIGDKKTFDGLWNYAKVDLHRRQAWDATVNSKDSGYFGDSLRVLSLLQIGNWMERPY